MNGSPELFAALKTFQSQMTNIHKDKTANTGKFGYRYADIAGVIESIREPLAANGLCYSQILDEHDGRPALSTVLAHETGGYLVGTVPFSGDLSDPQKFGGVVTYYRRYALLGILGLATDDDDAQSAIGPGRSVNVAQGSARIGGAEVPLRESLETHPVNAPGASQRAEEDMTWTDLYGLTRPMGYANRAAIEEKLGRSIMDWTPAQVYAAFKDGELPAPSNGTRPQYPASDKQVDWIKKLLVQKGMDARAWPGWASYNLNMDAPPPVDGLDKRQASDVIELLKNLPDNPGMAAIIESSGNAHGR